MTTTPEYQKLLNEFLGSHPECIEGVRWMDLSDGSRELMLRSDTFEVFAQWAVNRKGVPQAVADVYVEALRRAA